MFLPFKLKSSSYISQPGVNAILSNQNGDRHESVVTTGRARARVSKRNLFSSYLIGSYLLLVAVHIVLPLVSNWLISAGRRVYELSVHLPLRRLPADRCQRRGLSCDGVLSRRAGSLKRGLVRRYECLLLIRDCNVVRINTVGASHTTEIIKTERRMTPARNFVRQIRLEARRDFAKNQLRGNLFVLFFISPRVPQRARRMCRYLSRASCPLLTCHRYHQHTYLAEDDTAPRRCTECDTSAHRADSVRESAE